MALLEELSDWVKLFNVPLLIETLNHIPTTDICPHKEDVFKAFKLCPLKKCNVVFLGQDPYPQKDVATGILFGNKKKPISPSLEIIRDASIDFTAQHNYPIEFDITLENWAEQGILMLNSALTTKVNEIGSHTQLWRPFMSNFIETLSHYQETLFVLFGQQAQTFEPYIAKHNHIFKEKHPAFYARSNKRMPSDLFYKINEYLRNHNDDEIMWYKELV